MFEEILEGEIFARGDFAGHLLGLLGVERLLGLLDQRQDIAHIQDAIGHPVRVERLEVGQLLADRREHDRFAGDGDDRQRRTTAGVTVEFGQDGAVETDLLTELLRRRDSVLTDHRVDDEQDILRLHGIANPTQFIHQLRVDGQAAGCVDDDDVVQGALGMSTRLAGHLHRITNPIPRLRGEDGNVRPLPHHAQLIHGVGTLQVRGHQQRRVTVGLQVSGEFARKRRLARTLQAGEQNEGRPRLGELQRPGLTAENVDEFFMNDLDDLLPRIERTGHFR